MGYNWGMLIPEEQVDQPAIIILLWVEGKPIPKQSFRYRKGGGYIAPRVTAWQSIISFHAASYMARCNLEPFTCPLEVSLKFYLPTRRRVDLDNLSKAVLDAMNQTVYLDDCQIVKLTIEKIFDRPEYPGVLIEVKGVT